MMPEILRKNKKAGQCSLSRFFLVFRMPPYYLPASFLSFFALAAFFVFLPAR